MKTLLSTVWILVNSEVRWQPCTTLLTIHLRYGRPLPGSDQGQFGWVFEQLGAMEDVLAQGKMISKGPLQHKPLCDSK